MWETWVGSLGWEDLLEKGKTTHSSTLAWREFIFQGLYSPWGCKESDPIEWHSLSLFTVPHNCAWLNLWMWHRKQGWLNFKQTFTAGVRLVQGPQTSHYSNVNYNSYANKVDVKTPEGKLHALFISCMEPASIITFFPVTSEDLKYRLWSHNVSISTFTPKKH